MMSITFMSNAVMIYLTDPGEDDQNAKTLSRESSRSGFTLVELLVVISIIALLVSILLPALNKAREQAKYTVCKAHMHSMGMAAFYYGEDNNDLLVPAGLGGSLSFDVLLDPYLDQDKRLETDSGIWACPSDKLTRNTTRVPNPPHPPRSYVINAYLSVWSTYGSKSVKLSNTPPDMLLFGEYWSTENGCRTEYGAGNFFTGIFWVGLEPPYYGRYHLDRFGNFIFPDLSVQSYSLEEINAMPWKVGYRYYWE